MAGIPMFCVQCGFKIEDGYKFCPNCGTKVVSVQDDTQQKHEIPSGELDKIADDIFWRDPRVTISNISKLQKAAKIDASIAKIMLQERAKEFKRGVDKRICPRCGSRDIVIHRNPDTAMTISFSEGIYHTAKYNSGKVHGECFNCGNKWKAKLI